MSVIQTIRQNTRKNTATVTEIERFGDGMRRITTHIEHPLAGWTPGQAIGVMVDPDGDGLRDRWRHYTVRHHEAATGTLQLVVVDRDDSSPAGRWMSELDVDSTFTFMGPGGNPKLTPGASHYVFVGDRTSVASIGSMVDALSGATPTIDVVIATPDPANADLGTVEQTPVRWLAAESAHEVRSATLDALPDRVPADARAYVTGELEMMREVRSELTRRGLSKRSIGCHAHWTPSRRGM
ncbi:MAG: siderophore-interacting protein [Actinomycetota bacterium]